MARSLLGTVISGRYRIEELLSESATAAMFRGEHVLMHKRIAVKVVSPRAAARPEVLARFEREAIAGAHVDHPNVAAAKDFGALEDGSHFLVMEYLDGPTLRQALGGGAVPLERALRIVRQVALALDAAHAMGIVHRALRPENIHLVQRGGERDVVKLVDFGLAKLPAELVASASSPAGRADRIATPIASEAVSAYASPELVIGREVDGRTDLYALGMILYELVSGTCPDVSRGGPVPPLAGPPGRGVVPPELDGLARRLVDEDPEQRVGGAIEVVETIDGCLAALTTSRRLALGGLLAPAASPAVPAEAVSATVMSPTPSRVDTAVSKRATRSALRLFGDVPRSILLVAGGALATVLLVVVAIGLRAPFPPDEPDAQPSSSPLRSGPGDAPTSNPSPARMGTPSPSARPNEDAPEPPPAGAREVWTRLGKELSSGRFKDAVGSLDRLLELDPKAYEDREVRGAIVELASRVSFIEGPDAARMFDMIETRMGTVGPDILFELMATKGGSKAAKRAEELLRDKSVRERGTPALRVAYDLRSARKCDQKIALLERARDDGDSRSYGALQMMNRDCRRNDECCLKKDPRLKEAMDAIKDRIR